MIDVIERLKLDLARATDTLEQTVKRNLQLEKQVLVYEKKSGILSSIEGINHYPIESLKGIVQPITIEEAPAIIFTMNPERDENKDLVQQMISYARMDLLPDEMQAEIRTILKVR